MSKLIIIIALIIGWVIYANIKHKRREYLYRNIFLEIFENSEVDLPTLKTGNSYSFPSFTITFKTEEQLKSAEGIGLTKQFEEKIQQIHINIANFKAERSVFFTWEGRTFKIVSH